MQHINIVGAKGGVGATTVAVAIALDLARTQQASAGQIGIIGYHRDDITATFGCGTRNADRLTDNIWYGTGDDITVVDYGTGNLENMVAGPTFLVTRGCYLALRRAVGNEALMNAVDGVVLFDEPGRALERKDVAGCLGKPIVATIPIDPTVARNIDAGLMAVRTPTMLQKPIHAMLTDQQALLTGATR